MRRAPFLTSFFIFLLLGATALKAQITSQQVNLARAEGQRQNDYDDRSVHGSSERAHLYSFFGGLYYHINEHLTWSVDAVYTQNNSNIPELEYKDPIYSTGLHLHF